MAKKEPTNREILNTLTDCVSFVKTQFEKNERVIRLVAGGVAALRQDVKELQETTTKSENKLRHIEQDVLVIREDVETLGKIVGRDSSTVKSHGHRITRLERSKY